jgi:hypothetical protein
MLPQTRMVTSWRDLSVIGVEPISKTQKRQIAADKRRYTQMKIHGCPLASFKFLDLIRVHQRLSAVPCF